MVRARSMVVVASTSVLHSMSGRVMVVATRVMIRLTITITTATTIVVNVLLNLSLVT